MKFTFAACAVALSLAAAGAASAQGSVSQGMQRQPDLHGMLHLTPRQEGAWQAYQSAQRPTPDEMTRMRATSPQALGAMGTPERLDRINSFLNLQLQVFHRQADATRAFYATLTPDQQHTFDQVTAPPAQGRGSQQGAAPRG